MDWESRSYVILVIACFFTIGKAAAQCTFTVDAGPDKVVCMSGETARLEGSVDANITDFSWSPPNGLSNPNSLSPNVTVTGPATYTLTGTAVSTTNLFTNGDFEAGDSGFSSQYQPWNFNFPTEGNYYITDNPLAFLGPLGACVDHTTGSGFMMLVDGATVPGLDVWCQTVPVNPNTDYIFTAWFLTEPILSPTIEFYINGNLVHDDALPTTLCSWYEVTFTWNSGAATSANVCIQDATTAAFGNDFSIDDISFYEVCEISDEVEVDVSEIELIVDSYGTLSCDNPSLTLNASNSLGSNLMYLWSTFDGFIDGSFSDPIVTITAPGTYTINIIDEYFCRRTRELVVTGEVPPSLMVLGAALNCMTPEVQIFADSDNPDVAYDWVGPNGFISDEQNPFVQDPGTYVVTISLPSGCMVFNQVEVTGGNEIPDVMAEGGLLTCLDTLVVLTAATNSLGAQIQWTGPNGFMSNENSPTVRDTGFYQVTITSQDGCPKDTIVYVGGDTEVSDLELLASTINCLRDTSTILINEDLSNAQVAWSGPNNFASNQGIIDVVNPGNYYVTVTFDGNCIAMDSIQVMVDTLPPDFMLIDRDTLTCLEDTIELMPTGLIGNQLDIIWTLPNSQTSTDTVIQGFVPGTYYLELIDENGCSKQDSVRLDADQTLPQISLERDTINCANPSVFLQPSFNVSIDQAIWTYPDGSNNTLISPEVNIPGNYILEIISAAGCSARDSVEIAIDTLRPEFTLSTDTLTCEDPSVQVLVGNLTGPISSFSWQGPNGLNQDSLVFNTSSAGDYLLEVIGSNGCAYQDSIEVIARDQIPVLSVSIDTIDCINTDIIPEVVTTDNLVYEWVGPNGFFSNDMMPLLESPGRYTLLAANQEGCEVSIDIVVEVDTLAPLIEISGNDLNCLDRQTTLLLQSTSAIDSIWWSLPDGVVVEQSPVISYDLPGVYEAFSIGENGCVGMDTLRVVIDTIPPLLTILLDSISCNNPAARYEIADFNNSYSYSWVQNGQQVQDQDFFSTSDAADIEIQVIGSNACISTERISPVIDTIKPDIRLNLPLVRTCNDTRPTLLVENISALEMAGIGLPNQSQIPYEFTTIGSLTVSSDELYEYIAIGLNGCRRDTFFQLEVDTATLFIEAFGGNITCAQQTVELMADFDQIQGVITWYDSLGQLSNGLVSMDGIYTAEVENIENGCVSSDTALVRRSEEDFVLSAPDSLVVTEGALTTVMIDTDLPPNLIESIVWSLGDSNCLNCQVHDFIANGENILEVSLTNKDGCTRTSQIRLIYDRLPEIPDLDVFVPNVFSPQNEDGRNDRLVILAAPGIIEEVIKFEVFNRWGGLLFATDNMIPNDDSSGWDGRFNGVMMNTGVYTYFAEIQLASGKIQVISGDITLL